MRTLVVGARPGSLGAAIAEDLRALHGDEAVVTAGISGEQASWNAHAGPLHFEDLLKNYKPDSVVMTTGVNLPAGMTDLDLQWRLEESLIVNTLSIVTALQVFVEFLRGEACHGQFVAISSNSAHIARRGSIPYCASKAALSMALRCAARELAGDPCLVYGYEFGLLAGTPMTAASAAQFAGPLTRMPGAAEGLDVRGAAARVVHGLRRPWQGVNGVMLRLDAGEQ